MKPITCIVCPKGCRILQESGQISGYRCRRGLAYAQTEFESPKRVLTHTVRLQGGLHPRLPVKTLGEIPKDKLKAAAQYLESITVTSPVALGDIITPNILGTGVDVAATRSL